MAPSSPFLIAHPTTLHYRRTSMEFLREFSSVSKAFLDQMDALKTAQSLSDEAYIAAWNEFIAAHVACVASPILAAPREAAANIAELTLQAVHAHLAQVAADRGLDISLSWSIAQKSRIIAPEEMTD